MKPILVNCQRLPFSQTLGVSHFLVRLCSALRHECKLIFVVPDFKDLNGSPVQASIEQAAYDVVSTEIARRTPSLKGTNCIELRPHHFQERCFSDLSTIICHDLHVFDIGWKYKNLAEARAAFRTNLLSANAVVAHFPRTYYAVEATADITLMNLFLTESPLLFDTARSSGVAAAPAPRNGIELIYPAQLQRHKNHEVLIQSARQLKDETSEIRLTCPGTSFESAHTERLLNLVRRYELEDVVTLPGRLTDDELRDLYWRCDGVIVPSLAEGGAYIPLEALAAGLPVAVNKIAAAKQHLQAVAADVLWFDATSVPDTARAMRRLATADRQRWLEVNATARQRISEMTWDKVARKWILLFRWLSGEVPRPQVQIDRTGWDIQFLS